MSTTRTQSNLLDSPATSYPYAGPQYSAQSPAPAPMPMYMSPQQATMIAVAPVKPRGSRTESLLLSLIVLIVVAAAGLAAYGAAKASAPTEQEFAVYGDLANNAGYRRGETAGLNEGRNYAAESSARINELKVKIANQKAFNAGYRNGKRTGLNNYRQPARSGYGGYYGTGYSAPRYNGYSNYGGGSSDTASAISSAQFIADTTGVPVDVEVYN